MKSKLLLSLWLLGAVLYTGSTLFLASAVLGGIGGGDKSKPTNVAAAADAQCQKASVPSGEAGGAKAAAALPQKPAPADKPQETASLANRSAPPPSVTGASGEPSEQAPSADGSQDQEASARDRGQDQANADQDWAGVDRSQAGADQGQPGPDQDPAQGEWAGVVAGTADMRSDPSVQSPMIYALPAGWQVRVISRRPGWVQVQDPNSGAAGWVEATALAPSAGPEARPGYDAAGPGYRDPDPSWRWEQRRSQFGEFVRRALGGF